MQEEEENAQIEMEEAEKKLAEEERQVSCTNKRFKAFINSIILST